MLQRLLIILIAFLGMFFGVFLARIAPEEIRVGKRYLLLFQKILFLGLSVTMLISFLYAWQVLLPLVGGFLVGLFLRNPLLYLGLSMAVATVFSPSLFFLTAIFVFLIGFPYGSLHSMKVLQHESWYFFTPLLLLLFPASLAAYVFSWSAAAAGALLAQVFSLKK